MKSKKFLAKLHKKVNKKGSGFNDLEEDGPSIDDLKFYWLPDQHLSTKWKPNTREGSSLVEFN